MRVPQDPEPVWGLPLLLYHGQLLSPLDAAQEADGRRPSSESSPFFCTNCFVLGVRERQVLPSRRCVCLVETEGIWFWHGKRDGRLATFSLSLFSFPRPDVSCSGSSAAGFPSLCDLCTVSVVSYGTDSETARKTRKAKGGEKDRYS